MKISVEEAIAAGANPDYLRVTKVTLTMACNTVTKWVKHDSKINIFRTATCLVVQTKEWKVGGVIALSYASNKGIKVNIHDCSMKYNRTVEIIEGNELSDEEVEEARVAWGFFQRLAAFRRRHRKVMESIRHPKGVSPIKMAQKAKEKRERRDMMAKSAFAKYCVNSDTITREKYIFGL